MEQASYSLVASADGNRKCVAEEYQAIIPEAQNIFWSDDFFDEEEGIIAVFDYDYDQMIPYETSMAVIAQGVLVIYMPLCAGVFLGVYGAIAVGVIFLFFLCPWRLKEQVTWYVHAHHIALTRDGIRFAYDRRKTWWGLPMCDMGKYCKTIPFDQIIDIDITEPGGNACFYIPRVLCIVNVHIAVSASRQSARQKLPISGLKEPHKFHALVLAMKRAYCQNNVAPSPESPALPTAVTVLLAQLEREMMLVKATGTSSTSGSCPQSSDNLTALLQSIREELRENNELLRKMCTNSERTPEPLAGNIV